jgi:hypothetical protein
MFINNNDDEDIPIALSFPNKLKSANFVNRLSSKFYDFNNQKSLLEQEEHDELERLLRKNQNKHLESGKKVLEMTPKEKNSKRMKVDESQNKLENKENNSKDDNFADTKSEAKPNRKKKKFDDNYRKLTMKKKMHFSASAAGKFNLKGSKYKRFQWSKNKQKYEKTGKFGVKPPGELDDQHSNLNLIHFIDPNNSGKTKIKTKTFFFVLFLIMLKKNR